jgi:RNA polymerase sigma-70 factor, ECF subfamily
VDDPEPLIAALGKGDRTVFGPLFECFRPRLLRMVQFRLDPRLMGRVDAEDIVQEAFMDAEKRLQAWLDDQRPFHVWLRLVVQQTMTDVYRRHLGASMRSAAMEVMKPNSHSLSGLMVGTLTSPSQAAMREELKQQLTLALDQMDHIDREVLVLRHFEELSNKEVAEVLGLQENAASNRYVRALGRLKGMMERNGGLP